MWQHDPDRPDNLYRIYHTIWQNMDRENNLINHRITWGIVFSGGIFAASAILIGSLRDINAIERADIVKGIIFLIAACLAASGVFFSIRTREGVRAAHSQLDYLKEKYLSFRKGDENIFEKVYKWPRPFGDPHDHLRGNKAAIAFPDLMLWTWLFIALVEFALACYFLTPSLLSRVQTQQAQCPSTMAPVLSKP